MKVDSALFAIVSVAVVALVIVGIKVLIVRLMRSAQSGQRLGSNEKNDDQA